ncbi:MAG: multidrug effflux MFS transporter [Propionicimonas sp.]|uniref:multidrug effflux MFS transporter n=1 Tax=Propionicimonas sp. TaxID=1955623 RepID=UPI003D119C23
MSIALSENAAGSRTSNPTITPSLLVTLALLAAAAPFAMDLYLPAFPSMVGDLSTTATGVQLSLTAFMIGAGLGQVTFGPLSDRVGRLRPLLWGTAIYVVASAAAALAPTVVLLVAARLVQGFAGAAGMVIGRAVISDLARGQAAARAFSLMMLVGGVAPVVAPVAGSLLTGVIGWRGLLWIVAGLGAVSLVASVVFIRETLPAATREHRRATQASPGVGVLLNRRFLGNALAFAFAFATMIAYISASPFLFQDLMGMSEVTYGLVFGLNALVLMVTGGLSARLAGRFHAVQLARTGLLANLGAVVAIAALVITGAPLMWLLAPILVAVASLGFVLGNTTALALDQVAGATGLGSAALGLIQFGLAGIVAPLVSIAGTATVVPLAATMLVASLAANLAFHLAGHRVEIAPAVRPALEPVEAD